MRSPIAYAKFLILLIRTFHVRVNVRILVAGFPSPEKLDASYFVVTRDNYGKNKLNTLQVLLRQ